MITAVARTSTFPQEAWVIEGKGLTVYPGLIDSFTDVGFHCGSAPGGAGEGGGRAASRSDGEISRGPEDRPGSTPWRMPRTKLNLERQTHRDVAQRRLHHRVSAPKGGFFPGQAAVLDLGRRTRRRSCGEIRRLPFRFNLQPPGGFGRLSRFAHGRARATCSRSGSIPTGARDAQADYEKNPRACARPRYDHTDAALADALEDQRSR